MAVRAHRRAAKNGRRSESMGGIGAAQSANQGIEQKTRTKRWSWTDRCLPAHRDYCEAAAWSVTEINDEVWGSMFSFLDLFHFLYFWPGRGKNGNRKDGCFPARTGVQSEETVDSLMNTTTVCIFSLLGSSFSPLTLMIVWDTFKIKKKNNTVYWLEWIYLLIASLCNVGDNVYFSTDLLKSPPV